MAINNIFFLKIIILSLIITPSLSFISGIPSIRLDDIFIFLWLFIAIFYFKYSPKFIIKTRISFLLILSVYFLLPVINGLLNGFDGNLSDLNQYIRFIKYFSFYWLSYKVFISSSESQKKGILDFSILAGMILFVITVTQFFNFFNMNELYVEAISPSQYKTLVGNSLHPRPVGMIGNPNELGFLLALLSILALYCALRYRSNVYYICLIAFATGCLATLSRSSAVSLVVGIFIIIFILYFKGGLNSKIKSSIIIMVFLIVFYFIIDSDIIYEKILWRFEAGINISDENSLGSRFDNWSENIDIIKSHPIVGVGPLRRASFQHFADNEWLLIWRSYGFFGVILIISIFLKGIFSSLNIENRALLYAVIVSSFLYMLPAVIFHSLVLFPIVLFILALIDSESGNFKKYRPIEK